MSRFADLLLAGRPTRVEIPAELERAWTWMEAQGHGADTRVGYRLTAYPGDRVLGPVFAPDLGWEGWFEPGSPATEVLLPIAEIAGDGSIAALWVDPDGRTRVVAFESEGSAYILADSASRFLALLAIGYDELYSFTVGSPPEEPEATEAVAGFREWVKRDCGIDVPDEWPAVGDDDFSAWVDAQLGHETTPPPALSPDAGVSGISGDAVDLLGVIGMPDGGDAAARVGSIVGVTLGESLRTSGKALRAIGLEAESDRYGVSTLWITVGGGSAYPRPDDLIHGITTSTTYEEALGLLGEPERRGEAFLRYAVGGRYLHLQFEPDGLDRVTVMRSAP